MTPWVFIGWVLAFALALGLAVVVFLLVAVVAALLTSPDPRGQAAETPESERETES